MGAAGVAFGEPLTLSEWVLATGSVSAEALAEELMARVQLAMPVLPVPLIASILRTRGPMAREALEAAFADETGRLRRQGARVLMPKDDGLKAALAILTRRGMVREAEGMIGLVADRADLADYYAATVLPLIEAKAATIIGPEKLTIPAAT
jgi:glycerol-3-phosphate O-acyltransferase